ncbi:MAG: carbamoyltransferase N-terminal domain-containing protein [Nocardioides sp.]
MITVGLKLTHDSAIALVDSGKLVFCIEIEKLDNNPRYTSMPDLDAVAAILGDHGYALSVVDEWIVDGWDGREPTTWNLPLHGEPVGVHMAPYREVDGELDVLRQRLDWHDLPIGVEGVRYQSYSHVAGHIASVLATNPFCSAAETSLVLVWDGGLFPRLYLADPEGRLTVRSLGSLFPIVGHVYATAAHHFGPFKRAKKAEVVDDLSVAGKLMAYIALGRARPEIIQVLRNGMQEHFIGDSAAARRYRRQVGGFGSTSEPSLQALNDFFADMSTALTDHDEADVLASVHACLEELLVESLTEKIAELQAQAVLPESGPFHMAFVGGCALNIKWNSRLRSMPEVASLWVPPFPNDSGSAIGCAFIPHLNRGLARIEWDVKCGPRLRPAVDTGAGWVVESCSPAELGALLHRTGEPVVVLTGRADVGPRALGSRSILAPATEEHMKKTLNAMKLREDYRPVAPICLEEQAQKYFDPGTSDPYMLFDHKVRDEFVDVVPGILHLDGTARLQTVGPQDDSVLREILVGYFESSGVAVLCNTSANLHGRGFFPDVASAQVWKESSRIWSDGKLYARAT